MFNITNTDQNLSEMLRISSFIISEICEKEFMRDCTSIPLSKNQFYILKILSGASPFNLSDLANILSVSNAAVGKNIDKLVQHNLVRRRFRKMDRRTAKISITTDGNRVVESYNNLKIKKQTEIFKQFSNKEKEQLIKNLTTFVQNTLHKDMDTDILCLQCNGSCGDNCIVKETKGICIRNL